jgi:hypothetical protein
MDRSVPSSRRSPSVLGALLAVVAAAALVAPACQGIPQPNFTRTLTSTVTLSAETNLVLVSPVALTATGSLGRSAVYATLEAVVTASTATKARVLAGELSLDVTRVDAADVKLDLGNPPGTFIGALGGSLSLGLPASLGLTAEVDNGTTVISGLTGPIAITSNEAVKITGGAAGITVSVQNGNAIVDTALLPGGMTTISVGQGDIELDLPAALSADLAVQSGSAQIVINHPALSSLPLTQLTMPLNFGQPISVPQSGDGMSFQATVNGGAAVVRAVTQSGQVVINAR